MPRISAATVAEHRAAQQRALLNAAHELLQETSEAPTMADVAARAGLSPRYFSIKFTRPDKTFEARRDFLSICPTDSDPVFTKYHKPALINAIARGAGNCDAKFLNSLNKAYYEKKIVDKGWSKWNNDDDTVRIERVEYVKNELPPYCKVYEENEYTQGVVPIYVGVEKEDGHYVDPPPQ